MGQLSLGSDLKYNMECTDNGNLQEHHVRD